MPVSVTVAVTYDDGTSATLTSDALEVTAEVEMHTVRIPYFEHREAFTGSAHAQRHSSDIAIRIRGAESVKIVNLGHACSGIGNGSEVPS